MELNGGYSMRYDTYCGLYCGACRILFANKKNRVEQLASEWKMKPEELICTGCKTDTLSVFCQECEIKQCAKDKGLEFCFMCSDYPCKLITDFKNDDMEHHSIVLHNQDSIKNRGIDSWLKEQKIKWSCPECGESYSWYDNKCSKCGSLLKNSIDDERELDL